MKVFKILFFLFIFSSCIANVKQDNFRKHVVAKGETVYQIAKQYQVTPLDIYKLNPDAINGIEESSILLIPKLGVASVGIEKYQDAIKRHKVLTKETLYSIAKLYEVSVADLQEWNEELLKDGLKIDQEIVVSAKYKAFKKDVVDDSPKANLRIKIIKGDAGDGVPNVLSDDNVFVEGIRQTPVTKKKLEGIIQELEHDAVIYDTWYRNFQRNQTLIDLSYTPDHLKSKIINEYQAQKPASNRSLVLPFLINKNMKQLIESVEEFL